LRSEEEKRGRSDGIDRGEERNGEGEERCWRESHAGLGSAIGHIVY
jgi:hypothetical protein